jgi:hypothetical protein
MQLLGRRQPCASVPQLPLHSCRCTAKDMDAVLLLLPLLQLLLTPTMSEQQAGRTCGSLAGELTQWQGQPQLHAARCKGFLPGCCSRLQLLLRVGHARGLGASACRGGWCQGKRGSLSPIMLSTCCSGRKGEHT